MPNHRTLRASRLSALAAIGALGLALIGPVALAQTHHAKATVHRIKGVNSSGVIVRAPRTRPPHIIPPDKRAEFDDESAKAESWKKYRSNTPSMTDSTLGQANSYPGLHTLLPPN